MVKFLGSLSVGFLVGVFTHSVFLPEPTSTTTILIMIMVGLFLGLFSRNSRLLLIGIFVIGSAFGLLRFATSINQTESQILDLFAENQENIILHGTITTDPTEKAAYTEFVLGTDQMVTHAELTLPVVTQILVRTDTYTDYEYGQEIVVEGRVQKPEAFLTDTNRTFDYRSYLQKDEVYYTMSYAKTMVFGEGENSIQRRLYRLKNIFLERIYQLVPEPESGLLAGILFGEKSALDADWEERFRIVGLMHIVVLSGYNVSLVIQVFTKTLRFLPRVTRSVLAVVAILAFALLVGAGPTVVRASIMAVFIVLADVLGARYHITRALFIAGLLMVVWNPMILYFDISFQLSFLATYGLIVLAPHVERWFSFLPNILAIRESAVATVAAQIMVLPLIVYSIGEFSLISPLVNVLVLFAVPWAMFVGFITALVALVGFGTLSSITAVVTTYLLKYQLWIVDVFAALPFSHITIPPFHWTLMAVAYLGLFWWVRKLERQSVI